MQNEPLLQDNKDRFVIFPVKHHDIWDYYEQLKKRFLTHIPGENPSVDTAECRNLDTEQRDALLNFLNFFSASTARISCRLTLPFLNIIKSPEAAAFLRVQLALENIHAEAAAAIVQALSSTASTRSIQKALEKKEKWLDSFDNLNFPERLLAASISEKMFSTDIFLLKRELHKRGILPEIAVLLEKIEEEISLFSDFTRFLHDSHVSSQVSKDGIIQIVSEALLLEKQVSEELSGLDAFGVSAEDKDKALNLVAEEFISANKEKPSKASEEDEPSALAQKRAEALNKNTQEKPKSKTRN